MVPVWGIGVGSKRGALWLSSDGNDQWNFVELKCSLPGFFSQENLV